MIEKYARLLTTYCLRIAPGDRVLIRGSVLALPLIEGVHKAAIEAGGIPTIQLSSGQLDRQLIESNRPELWESAAEPYRNAVTHYNAILTISAPENSKTLKGIKPEILTQYTLANSEIKKIFMHRSGNGDLRWCICLYPTAALAQDAEMSTDEFTRYVWDACGLYEEDPIRYWETMSHTQQRIVDRLNQCEAIRYYSANMDISFSVKGRRWINSDGRRNMPSGEVFTSPVESSVNGYIQFDYPLIYQGAELNRVRFEVRDGEIQTWTAETGQAELNALMAIPGARFFGEAAIGTNTKIQRHIKNILFDEKIGGTIHMAIGASYPETGGLNESAIHLDLIADMRASGQIFADGQLIYENGEFLESWLTWTEHQ